MRITTSITTLDVLDFLKASTGRNYNIVIQRGHEDIYIGWYEPDGSARYGSVYKYGDYLTV